MSIVRSWKKISENNLEEIALPVKEILLKNAPALLILSGNVGAGKTTFTKRFIHTVLNKDKQYDESNNLDVISPTYSIINKVKNIVHADFYRIEDREEIVHLELGLYLDDCELLLIEWGKDYLDDIEQEIGPQFNKYELKIEHDNREDKDDDSRDFYLATL